MPGGGVGGVAGYLVTAATGMGKDRRNPAPNTGRWIGQHLGAPTRGRNWRATLFNPAGKKTASTASRFGGQHPSRNRAGNGRRP
jgi:hypothetical protein